MNLDIPRYMRVAFGIGYMSYDEKGNLSYKLERVPGVPCIQTDYYSEEKFFIHDGFKTAFCPPKHLQNPTIKGNWNLASSDYFAALVIPCHDMPGIDVKNECESREEIMDKKNWITTTLLYVD